MKPVQSNLTQFTSGALSLFFAAAILLTSRPLKVSAAPIQLTVQADKPGARINPGMWGIFFEDINFGADGGLYAELVKNRSFEFPQPMMGWSEIGNGNGKAEIRTAEPFDAANPHYLHLEALGKEPFGVSNEGFRGMGIREGEDYDFSAQLRIVSGDPSITLTLVGANGKTLASTQLAKCGQKWQKSTATLPAHGTSPKARLNLTLTGAGAVDLDMVSLFPHHTWKNRPGGLRADMVQKLADLKPGFMRFPGGCIVEGSELSRRYQWKTTIGPVEERKLIINRWNYEFKHRPTPDYFQSFGLGFFEFFQLCNDIGARPLPILNCGMACQFNTGQLVPLEQLEPYIQDAFDLIEFANGDTSTTWGARRAAFGHPAPFHLQMLGVGNEQWGPQYLDRYARFAKALKAKYPEVLLVSAAGPSPADDRFQFLWPKLRELNADIVDEHCYANPVWFLSNSERYDHYERNGPKVFMGEYAAQSIAIVSPNNRNNLDCALAEAAYMTGLERNADLVRMASYAPLFANIDAWQWTPDLIWADTLRVYATPNYYVQQLFMQNHGDAVLPVSNDAPVPEIAPAGSIGLGTSQTAAEFKDIRVTQGGKTLLSSESAMDEHRWSTSSKWSIVNGALRQADPTKNTWAWAGGASWNNYTLSLKARKLSGSEGFLIGVRGTSPEEYISWNLGGWGNQFHGVVSRLGQQDQLLARVPGSIEKDRWYDIRIALKGTKVDCYLDEQLIQSVDIPTRRTPNFFASATQDDAAREIILKAVNPTRQPFATRIALQGLNSIAPKGDAIVLSSTDPADENSFEAPDKVHPVTEAIATSGPNFSYTFKPYSLTILRIPR